MTLKSKRLTLNDIAQLTGVSKTTVSMVLNGKSDNFRIKEETKQKIITVAKKHHYKANPYAKALQAQRSNTIGLVVPDFVNLGFATTTKVLEKLCRDNGLQLLITCSDEDPKQEAIAIEKLLERQIDLLITTPTLPTLEHYPKDAFSIPLIQLDRVCHHYDSSFIVTDDQSAVQQLISKLIQKYSINEFYYLGGQATLRPSIERLNGFKQGLKQAKLRLQDQWIIETNYSADAAYQALANIYRQSGKLPEALFTGSYALLEGVLRFLNEHHLLHYLTQQKLHLCTFDDYELLNCLPFKIHSIKQQHQYIATELFNMIQAKLDNQSIDNKYIIPAQIIWRD